MGPSFLQSANIFVHKVNGSWLVSIICHSDFVGKRGGPQVYEIEVACENV